MKSAPAIWSVLWCGLLLVYL
uniref:Predicted protein n=1 Tax=Hordeum vulgare subsp. vulgare TaxID=112509 RepID=F2DN02_HORVV|nr:predicted protein [Hordeum vulgare subsp. vulgare]